MKFKCKQSNFGGPKDLEQECIKALDPTSNLIFFFSHNSRHSKAHALICSVHHTAGI